MINILNYSIPILGEIDAKTVSLPIFSSIVGFVDGFNPCAMWILIFLISMLFTMKDRKKMWVIGLTFILTSAIIYALFMVSWLNLAVFLSKINIIRLLISLFAIIFGMYNIYRFVDGLKSDVGCDVTKEKDRGKIMNYIRKIVTEKKFAFAILGTILLACSVNILELLCSLGLPVIFTEVLLINKVSLLQKILYISLYLFFFIIDDLIIFIIAMKTISIKAISNKYTKYSHLIGGIIMTIIGILLILKPEWVMFNF